jgi:hypothetical protein
MCKNRKYLHIERTGHFKKISIFGETVFNTVFAIYIWRSLGIKELSMIIAGNNKYICTGLDVTEPGFSKAYCSCFFGQGEGS